jgi:hypothetical protein
MKNSAIRENCDSRAWRISALNCLGAKNEKGFIVCHSIKKKFLNVWKLSLNGLICERWAARYLQLSSRRVNKLVMQADHKLFSDKQDQIMQLSRFKPNWKKNLHKIPIPKAVSIACLLQVFKNLCIFFNGLAYFGILGKFFWKDFHYHFNNPAYLIYLYSKRLREKFHFLQFSWK